MKIWLYTVTRNESKILPFFLRHYEQFCDRITVFDDNSDDGTQDIVRACPKAILEKYPFTGGLDDREFIQLAESTYRKARGQADWVIWCDPDEFLYHPKLIETLEKLLKDGVQVPLTRGFQMIHDYFPDANAIPPGMRDKPQIWEIATHGIEDPVYAKPVIFRPEAELTWHPGKHYVHGNVTRGKYCGLKVLHYRCLGLDYLRERHARNYSRCSKANIAAGLGVGVYPGHTGHMSESWFKSVLPTRRPVLKHSTFHELLRVIHGGENPYALPNEHFLIYPPEVQPTWGSEHPFLHETIEQVQPQVLIEVGSFLGRSAIHMALKLRAMGMDSAIICVDTWLGDHEHWTHPEVKGLLKHKHGRPEFYNTFLTNAVCEKVAPYLVPLPIDSISGAKLLSVLGVHADMIYIDGGHEGGEVYRDLTNYWTLLRAGGAMVMDDYADGRFPGLQADVDRFAFEQGLKLEVNGHKARVWKL